MCRPIRHFAVFIEMEQERVTSFTAFAWVSQTIPGPTASEESY
jgi:hypothetical protein